MRRLLARCVCVLVLACGAAWAQVVTLPLDGTAWTLRKDGDARVFPATVPGVAQLDLLAAGAVPEPFVGTNADALQWVGEATWIYARTFDVAADVRAKRHVVLRCEGIDTVASVRVNGTLVGEAANQFRTYEFDVKPHLKAGANTVEVTFPPLREHIAREIDAAKRTLSGPATWYDGFAMVRKPVYADGWDFGPQFHTVGLWRPVALVAWDEGRVTGVAIEQALTGDLAANQPGAATLDVTAEADGDGLVAVATVTRAGKTVATTRGTVKNGAAKLALKIDRPELWWPAGMGAQALYDVAVEVRRGDTVLDRAARRVGLRRVELLAKSDDRPLRLRVNSRELFAKGANWIPCDAFAPRETPERVRALLEQGARAHFNSVRVWGGGHDPGRAFFDACDELGLLVWFDFAYACKPYPIGNPAWAENVRAETRDVVRRLRHHPSLAVWCGNNEVDGVVKSFGLMGRAEYNQLFHNLIGATVRQEHPSAQYVGGSPEAGDEHNWWVWHLGADFEHYRQSHGWMTEFGFQSHPVPATVEHYTAPEDRASTLTDMMRFHQRNGNGKGNDIILDQTAKYFRAPKDFESTLWLSQINQAHGMTIGVEHWRADWPKSSGAYVWQFDDVWPGTTWSCVDYFGRAKAVLYRLRHAYAPLLVTSSFDEAQKSAALTVVSELAAAGDVRLAWKVTDLDGRALQDGRATVRVAAGTASTRGPTLDLADALAKAGAPAHALLWVDATAPGGTTARAAHLLARPKALELRDPQLTLTVKKAGDDAYDVTIKAARPALWAWLDLAGDPDARYGDNFVHLDPATPATIRVTPSKPIDLAAVTKALRARSLYDTHD